MRVSVHNHGGGSVNLSPGLWANGPDQNIATLRNDSNAVPPGATHYHDYVTYADRFDVESWSWPSTGEMIAAGSLDEHYNHMKTTWDARLNGLANLNTPDPEISNAIRAGIIYSLIIRDYRNYTGDREVDIPVAENGYEDQYNHDIVGINAAMVIYGALDDDMKAALRDTPRDYNNPYNYPDGFYKHNWLYSLYRLKSGDQAFIDTYWPDILTMGHLIQDWRTGVNDTMKWSWGPDYWGYWTADSWAALAGLQGHKYLAQKRGDAGEVDWAENQFNDLRNRINQQINTYYTDHISERLDTSNVTFSGNDLRNVNHLHEMLMGRFPWEAVKYGVDLGQSPERIDATYNWHLNRCLSQGLPEGTAGGFNGDNYSTGYNTGYFSQGLAGAGPYRTGPIKGFQFMIEMTQCAPYGWWEGIYPPSPSPWIGSHPTGSGACPHGWGNSMSLYYILESLIAEKFDGTVIIGRGILNEWITDSRTISVSHIPITDGRRMNYQLTSDGEYIEISFTGDDPVNEIWVNLPVLIGNDVFTADKGVVDYANDMVRLPADTDSVIISLSGIPPIPAPTNVQATSTTGSQINVTWQDNSSGADQEDGFVIERRPYLGTDQWHRVGSVDPDTTSFTDTDEVYGLMQYTYRIGAVKN